MLFWSIAALLTLGASLAVLLPLARRNETSVADGNFDVEVYRDQLSELEKDVARKLVAPSDAEQARAEISRRIISADARAKHKSVGVSRSGRMIGAAAILAVPLVSWGLYTATGSPDIPDQPLAARLEANPADSSADELIARAEGHLASNPEDGRGWDTLAPIYVRIGRFADGATAYRNAIRLEGETSTRLAGLGEAITNAGGGIVSVEAQKTFEKAVAIEPAQPKAQFFLAIALSQEGRHDDAEKAWQAMLDTLPQDSPWRAPVERAQAESRRLAGVPPIAGPGQADVDAAADMSDADRNEMVAGMVARLDERLRQNSNDVDGWMQLVRSYMVLGNGKEAAGARDRGLAALGKDSEDGRKLADFAASLNVEAAE
ncbi:c-type cytochrome biogenesis protein CcmI [Mesorhizobium sp. SB112]|uniref:c-type cytochrome biogenesis protein CcmI n=1 Tax=Mesorhizobium sp. SB112 TaxID=3151853 RepID=UPI00326753B0